MTKAEEVLDTAVYYATEFRWPIFMCRDKRPLTRHGFKDATTDPERIERMLRHHPDADIASPAGIQWDVLDVDDSDAAATLREYGVLPMTVMQKTPSGPGVHFFWKHHEGITNRRGSLPKGVDVRGEGGYVLLPPSEGYEWLVPPADHEFAHWPPHLLALVRGNAESEDGDWEPLNVQAIFDGVPKGERDETAFRYACSLRGRDVPKKEALALMKVAWEFMEQPARDEFPFEQAKEKVDRAYKNYRPNRKDQKSDTPLRVQSPDMGKARPTEWLWHHRIPVGYLSLLLGEEGIGKGTLIVWVIAQLSRGQLEGDFRGEPGHVGIIGDEDDFDSVWTPRLQAAGADFEYVHYIDRPDFGYIELDADQERMATVVEEFDIQWLYLDQLLDNLGVSVDDWKRKEVRQALRPARALARTLDIAVTGSLHPNKRGHSFRELLSGSVAFNAVSRSSLLLATKLDDLERRVLVRGKGNLCPPPSAFEFDVTEFRLKHNGQTFTGPVVDNGTTANTDLAVDDLIGQDASRDAVTKIDKAKQLLVTLLPNDGQAHPCKPILEEAERQGLEYQTMYRAKRKVGLLDSRAGYQSEVYWQWPLRVSVKRRNTHNERNESNERR